MEATSPPTSQSLVQQVQKGDTLAWQSFASLYVPLVYQWTRRSGMQSSDALDITQNVFVSVVCSLAKFRMDEPGQSLRAWLRTITRNTIIDWRRSHGRQELPMASEDPQWSNLFVDTSATDHESPADERSLLVLRAAEIVRSEFAPATWEMFWQAVAEGRSAERIAADRGVSPWAVYKAKARVLARLRELVGDFVG